MAWSGPLEGESHDRFPPLPSTFRPARRNRSMGTEIDTVTKALRRVAALAQDGLSDVH
jgi:hypothetical protein